jgi:hypothetical protein
MLVCGDDKDEEFSVASIGWVLIQKIDYELLQP